VRPPSRRPGWLRRPPRWLLVVVLLLAAVAILGWSRCGISGCPDVSRLGAYQPGGAPVLLRLAEQVVVALSDLPPFVADAFVAVEDKRFLEHDGVDWQRVGGALFANVKAGGIREGSSTLTMQLARNLFAERIPAAQKTLGSTTSTSAAAHAASRRPPSTTSATRRRSCRCARRRCSPHCRRRPPTTTRAATPTAPSNGATSCST
jgi:membrane peptidoglycan carboxypeptidase